MKKLILLSLSAIALCFSSRAQLRQVKAYFTITAPGSQMTDESGAPLNNSVAEHFLIIELPAQHTIRFDRIRSGNLKFTAAGVKLPGKLFTAQKYNDEKAEKIRVIQRGNQLWKFTLIPTEKLSPGIVLKNLVIEGKLNKKKFRVVVKEEIQLASQERY